MSEFTDGSEVVAGTVPTGQVEPSPWSSWAGTSVGSDPEGDPSGPAAPSLWSGWQTVQVEPDPDTEWDASAWSDPVQVETEPTPSADVEVRHGVTVGHRGTKVTWEPSAWTGPFDVETGPPGSLGIMVRHGVTVGNRGRLGDDFVAVAIGHGLRVSRRAMVFHGAAIEAAPRHGLSVGHRGRVDTGPLRARHGVRVGHRGTVRSEAFAPTPVLPEAVWHIYVRRESDLVRVGQVEFAEAELNLRFLRASRFVVRASHAAVGHVRLGDGLLFVRNGETVLSGIVTRKQWARDSDSNLVELAGISDTGRLGWRVIYPTPGRDADDPEQGNVDQRTGPAESVMRHYVERNAGVTARPNRRIPNLQMLEDRGRGARVTGRGRWHNLLEYLRTLGDRSDDPVGVRVIQRLGLEPRMRVEFYLPRDRPEARFDLDGERGSGALRGFEFDLQLAEVTAAIAGGRGEGADRLVLERVDEGAPFRVERFLDQRNAGDEDDIDSQTDEIEDRLEDELRDYQEVRDFKLEPADTLAVRWPRDYELGDRVRVRFENGWEWRQVRRVEIRITPERESVEPKLAGPSEGEVLGILRRLNELERRVGDAARI